MSVWDIPILPRARFYVNRCGFVITEYFNERHPDPHFPQEEAGDYPGADGGLFKFEKEVDRHNGALT